MLGLVFLNARFVVVDGRRKLYGFSTRDQISGGTIGACGILRLDYHAIAMFVLQRYVRPCILEEAVRILR